ncbi:hypothetical protein [Magnetospirillum molischianum]|nr:hypothetical protein [Magnetospirillum molischianum]
MFQDINEESQQALFAFEQAAFHLWQTHRQHVDRLRRADNSDASPRTRRNLYNALKSYRKAEADLFRRLADADKSRIGPADIISLDKDSVFTPATEPSRGNDERSR